MSTICNVDVICPKKSEITGVVIFLHGSGDTGSELKSVITDEVQSILPHIKFIFPTASLKPYTLLNKKPSHVWFDRLHLSPKAPEYLDSINSSAEDLKELVEQEIKNGIPKNRIIVGGFSMGGAMAMHLAYRYIPDIAGVFALSSFLSYNSAVYETLKENKIKSLPPIFFCHGDHDDLVPIENAQHTFDALQHLRVVGTFCPLRNCHHELKLSEINLLTEWILIKIPK